MRMIFLMIVIVFRGCEFTKVRINAGRDKNEGGKVAEQYYHFLKEKRISDAYSLIDPGFSQRADSNNLKKYLVARSAQMQGLRGRKLDHWRTRVGTGLDKSAYYAFYYIDTCDGYEMKELIGLHAFYGEEIKITELMARPDTFPEMPDGWGAIAGTVPGNNRVQN